MASQKQQKETTIFIAQVAGAFIVTFIVLGLFGLLPKELKPDVTLTPTVTSPNAREVEPTTVPRATGTDVDTSRGDTTTAAPQTATKPTFISIPSIGVRSSILQPESPRVDVLDEALKKGAVYYPGSGTIEQGNIFLFGHSTNWAIVQNQAYKTFNDLDKLRVGEEIYLTAGGKTYVYEVETVSHVDANTAFVDLSRPGRRLTISTCDTFGAQSDRWVVDAIFKEVRG